jgi:hypothetical protein
LGLALAAALILIPSAVLSVAAATEPGIALALVAAGMILAILIG